MSTATPHEGPEAASPPALPPPLSRLALVALGLNIPCFLPPFTLLSALLGAAAWIHIARRPRQLRGAPIAAAAVVIGTALTIVGCAIWWPAARLMVVGPQDAIAAAIAGDHDGVRSAFAGAGAESGDDEIADFAATLTHRFGPFIRSRRADLDQPIVQRGETWTVPYRLEFEREAVVAEVDITVRDPRTGRSTLRISSIRVPLGDDLHLRLPRGSPTLSPP